MEQAVTTVRFDDGDALSEDVHVDGHLIGAIWTDGEGCGFNARAVSNVAGYWSTAVLKFTNRDDALRALRYQAAFERLPAEPIESSC